MIQGSNDTFWRVSVPAKAIGAKVVRIPVKGGGKQLSEPSLAGEFRWFLTEEGACYPDHEGVAVFTRPDQVRATHALAMKANGARIVAEVDDNYIAPRKLNLGMRTNYDEGSEDDHLRAISVFDAIIFSTDWLRDSYRKVLRKAKRGVPDLHVCGNHVDPDDWPVVPLHGGPLRVGWMGSESHLWDIRLAYPALAWAAGAGFDVKIIGYDPRWRPGEIRLHSLRVDSDGFDYDHIPWIDPRQFDRSRAVYPLDVALAPLRRDSFTLGKSDVKILEYGMSGATVIASSGTVYNSIRHLETGILAGSPEEFWMWTQRLCQDEKLRVELGDNLRQYIREERLVDQHTHDWEKAILG